jgi:hypothetical protein
MQACLDHIEEVNEYLKRIRDIIPFPAIQIDVITVTDGITNIDSVVANGLTKRDYDVIAMDSIVRLSKDVRRKFPPHVDLFHDPTLYACIQELNASVDPELRYCRSLAIKVYCEVQLAHIAYALKGFRDKKGGFTIISGLLIIKRPIDVDHLRTIFRVFNVDATIN